MSHQIDSLAYGNRLRWLPPSHKLSFTIVLLILSLISPPIVQAVISVWVFVWIVGYAAIPATIYLKLLMLPLSFWIASLPAFVIAFVINGADFQTPDIQTQTVMADVWRGVGMNFGRFYVYISDYGLQQVARLLIRALASTSCMYFILLTTPFTEVLQIFRQLRCPPLLT